MKTYRLKRMMQDLGDKRVIEIITAAHVEWCKTHPQKTRKRYVDSRFADFVRDFVADKSEVQSVEISVAIAGDFDLIPGSRQEQIQIARALRGLHWQPRSRWLPDQRCAQRYWRRSTPEDIKEGIRRGIWA